MQPVGTKMTKSLVAILLLTFALCAPAGAAVTVTRTESGYPSNVNISGEITRKDIEPFRAVVAEVIKIRGQRDANITLHLNSKGGDVLAAIEIGRLARTANATAWAVETCASSCVFILAGAVLRNAGNHVGIHRLTFSELDTKANYREVRGRMDKLEQAVRTFLKDMDIPESLLDAMKAVPPERIRWLSSDELEQFRLSGFDPTHQEMMDSRLAARAGISKQEYTRRTAFAEQECDFIREGMLVSQLDQATKQHFACVERVMKTGK